MNSLEPGAATRKILFIFLILLLANCAHRGGGGGARPAPVGVDPVLVWDAQAKDCSGANLPIGTAVAYNVYAVSGPGPIPTTSSGPGSPCGPVSLANGSPLNSAPVKEATYNAIVPDGVWTFGVEAVLPSGARSGLSNQVTVTVLNRSGVITGLKVGP